MTTPNKESEANAAYWNKLAKGTPFEGLGEQFRDIPPPTTEHPTTPAPTPSMDDVSPTIQDSERVSENGYFDTDDELRLHIGIRIYGASYMNNLVDGTLHPKIIDDLDALMSLIQKDRQQRLDDIAAFAEDAKFRTTHDSWHAAYNSAMNDVMSAIAQLNGGKK